MTERGVRAMRSKGTSVVDLDGELAPRWCRSMPNVYAKKDARGIWKCGIEQAHRDGKIPFHKPSDCHLYPIPPGAGGEYGAELPRVAHLCPGL